MLSKVLASLRLRLAEPRASYQLCLLAILAGLGAASLIILFRLAFENIQLLWLARLHQYQDLTEYQRLLLPMLASLGIFLFAWLTGFEHYRMGVAFVIHRVKHYYGQIPLKNSLNQFVGGMLALSSGFGVGKEGPSIHLGAAGSGFIGQWLKLPFNSIRILAGCGIAAGISACFNTPLAAVIFVMEVVLREYKIHIFIPVMLAAACGSLASQWVFGDETSLAFLQFSDLPLSLYFYLIPCGMIIGGLAALFNRTLIGIMQRYKATGMAKRLLTAALITGLVGAVYPQGLGAEFSNLAPYFEDPQTLVTITTLLFVKMGLTIVALALGVPGGIIGPIFGFGILAGLALLYPSQWWLMDTHQYQGSFALLGMAGMFAAILHAPLSALTAVMELSLTPQIIPPAMIVIVSAYITSVQLFKNRSVFLQQLDCQQLSYSSSSLRQVLQRHGVLSAMEAHFNVTEQQCPQQLLSDLNANPQQLLVSKTYSQGLPLYHWVDYHTSPHETDTAQVTLHPMQGLSHQQTLAEAYECLQAQRQGAVFIYQNDVNNIIGVLRWSTIRGFLTKERY